MGHYQDIDEQVAARYAFPVRADAGREEDLSMDQWQSAIGESGLPIRNGLVHIDPMRTMTPYKLRGLNNTGILDEMRFQDTVVAATYRSVTGTIHQGNPTFKPSGSPKDRDWDMQVVICEYWDWLLDQIAGGVRHMWELASAYPYYGFMAAEPVTRFMDSPWGPVLGLHRLEPRLPRSISKWVFHSDGPDRGQLAGLAQSRWVFHSDGPERGQPGMAQGGYGSLRIIPMDRVVLWTHEEALCGPEGYSLGRPMKFAWHAKRDVVVGDAGVTARWKFGVPMFEQANAMIASDPKHDKPIRAAIKSAMRRYVSKINGFLMPPLGYVFKVGFPQGAAPDPRQRVEMYNKEIMYVAHTLWMDPSVPGTGKVNSEHQVAFRSNIEHFALRIIETLCGPESRPGSGLLRRFARYNFALPPDFRWPTPYVRGIQHRDIVEKLRTVMLLLQSHGIAWHAALERWLVEELGAPRDVLLETYEDNAVVYEEEPEPEPTLASMAPAAARAKGRAVSTRVAQTISKLLAA